MKYFLAALAGITLLSFSACDSNTGGHTGFAASNSTGGFDEILVVADRENLRNYLHEPLKDVLRSSYEVLPQFEPTFTPRIIAYENFDRLFQRFRTIIFLADLSEKNLTTEFVKNNIGEQYVAKANKEEGFYYAMKRNVWAEPQLIIFVFEPNQEQLEDRVTEGFGKIVSLVQKNELAKYKNNVYLSGKNASLTKKLKEEHNLFLDIPKDYVLAIEDDRFLWIRWVTSEASNNIMISYRPLSDTLDGPIAWRNQLGKEYITSDIEGAYMTTETILPVQQTTTMINGYEAIESRGLWRMENDFMGGPFLNYLITDSPNNREVLLEGFVYAPGEKKKPEVRKLEAIFSTFGKAGNIK